jgi:hypothetical protein
MALGMVLMVVAYAASFPGFIAGWMVVTHFEAIAYAVVFVTNWLVYGLTAYWILERKNKRLGVEA